VEVVTVNKNKLPSKTERMKRNFAIADLRAIDPTEDNNQATISAMLPYLIK
jgi:hypothetical protein